MKSLRTILLGILIVVGGWAAIIGAFIGYDIYKDRQHTILIEKAVPAYSNWEQYPHPSKSIEPIFMIPAKTNTKVKRIRYGKSYMAVRVKNQEGKIGWIFSGSSWTIIKDST